MISTRPAHRTAFPLGWFLIAIIAICALFATARSQGVSQVESIGFTVSDMDKALDFYTRVLPFSKISDVELLGDDIEHLSGVFGARVRVVRLRLGDEILELTEYLSPKGRPIPIDSRSNDRWFQHIAIIVSDMEKAYAHLRANKVRHASTGPQTLPAYITAAAGIKAFYFKDPDDHVLEILSFPADKGAPRWHDLERSGKLFLGIDHTAIVVGDTDTSLRFYRDALGLSIAGESINYGPEQEHLNNVFGARLHISGLRTKVVGISVELLEYLSPSNGRAFPGDTKSNDIWHWQTSFAATTIDAIFKVYKAEYISTASVLLNRPVAGPGKAALIRDPDGHAIRLVEQ